MKKSQLYKVTNRANSVINVVAHSIADARTVSSTCNHVKKKGNAYVERLNPEEEYKDRNLASLLALLESGARGRVIRKVRVDPKYDWTAVMWL